MNEGRLLAAALNGLYDGSEGGDHCRDGIAKSQAVMLLMEIVKPEVMNTLAQGQHGIGLTCPATVQSIKPSLDLFGLADRVRRDRSTRGQKFLLKLERRHAEPFSHLVDCLADFLQIVDDGSHCFPRPAVCIMVEKAPFSRRRHAQGIDKCRRVFRFKFYTTYVQAF